MKPGNYLTLICIIACSIVIFSAATRGAGKIIDNVVCKADSGQSYALYLPPGYTAERKWPIIYAFDPGAKGIQAVTQFKKAAEEYGYIVVASNNAKNGPWEPIQEAVLAVWKDTVKRYAIDFKRVYSAGFSGGARVASVFRFISKQPVTGIIACGAGLNTSLKPKMIKPTLYFGIVGLGDFNYSEMMRLDKDLNKTGIHHRILVFDGGHQWPAETYCTEAVEWMEVQAIKLGLKQKDQRLINRLFNKTKGMAQQFEAQKNLFFSITAYEDAVQLYEGLVDVAPLKERIRFLKNSREYKHFLKNEKKRSRKEAEFIQLFGQVAAMVGQTSSVDMPGIETILRDLKIRYLLREAEKEDNIYDRGLARRLILGLRTNSFRLGSSYMQKGDSLRAGIFFEVLDRLGPTHPSVLYNLACFYSKGKHRKKALHYLNKAIEQGFDKREFIEKDADLDFIRDEPEYKRIIEGLAEKN